VAPTDQSIGALDSSKCMRNPIKDGVFALFLAHWVWEKTPWWGDWGVSWTPGATVLLVCAMSMAGQLLP
jgi:hypothetical protein